MPTTAAQYLDPAVLSRLEGLALRARLIVEGYVAGVHRSPFHGFSIEFAEHREYTPGDDLRYLDWICRRVRAPLVLRKEVEITADPVKLRT